MCLSIKAFKHHVNSFFEVENFILQGDFVIDLLHEHIP